MVEKTKWRKESNIRSIDNNWYYINPEYTTLEFFNDLIDEISKLVPASWLSSKGKSKGRIREEKLNAVLGLGFDFVRTKKRLIETGKSPNFKLSIIQINIMIKTLKKYFGDKAGVSIDHIEKYKLLNKLKLTPNQQWHLYNPHLKVDFFDNIDTVEKAFWFGFLCADGYVSFNEKKGNFVEISVAFRDKSIIFNFCEALGVNLKSTYEKEVTTKYGKIVKIFYVRIGCNPLAEALRNQGIFGSKSLRKELPKFSRNRKFFLAWLRGYYEGDGSEYNTRIIASNKQLLVHIKRALDLKNKVKVINKHFTFFDQDGIFHIKRTVYALSLGATIYNEMTKICKLENIPLLKRKDRIVSDRFERYDKFKKKLHQYNIESSKLQKMVFKYKKIELQKIFGISRDLLHKIIEEWSIITPPRGYWSLSIEKRVIFMKKLKIFTEKRNNQLNK